MQHRNKKLKLSKRSHSVTMEPKYLPSSFKLKINGSTKCLKLVQLQIKNWKTWWRHYLQELDDVAGSKDSMSDDEIEGFTGWKIWS